MGSRRSKLQITIWEPSTDVQQAHEGVGHHFDFGSLWAQHLGSLRYYNRADHSGAYRGGKVIAPSMRLIRFPDGVDALVSNTFADSWQSQVKAYWTFNDSARWEDSHDGPFGELWLHHFHSDADNEGTWSAWAESAFYQPPEPWFAVRLWRGEHNPEDYPYDAEPPHSYINFGLEYRVLIPYGGKVQLYIKGAGDSWVEMRPVEGDGLGGFEGTGNEAKTLYIATLRGQILLSWDHFQKSAHYEIPLGNTHQGQQLAYNRYWAAEGRTLPARVWSWKVTVGHQGGEFGFTYLPLQAFRDTTNPAEYDTPYVQLGHLGSENPNTIYTDTWFNSRRTYWEHEPGFALADALPWISPSLVTSSMPAGFAAQVQVKWTPTLWTNALFFTQAVGPAVFGVQLRQAGNPVSQTIGASHVITPTHDTVTVQHVQVEDPNEFGPRLARVKMMEVDGSFVQSLRGLQRMQIQMGSDWSAGPGAQQTVFDGWLRTPKFQTTRGPKKILSAELWGMDDLHNFNGNKFEGREPSFDFLTVSEGGQWCAALNCGIPYGRVSIPSSHQSLFLTSIERSSQTYGYAHEWGSSHRRWAIEAGTEYLPVMRDIAVAAGNCQWWYNQRNRTLYLTRGPWTETGYHFDLREKATTSAAFSIQKFDPQRDTTDDAGFANYVHLIGKDVRGHAIHAYARDTSSAFSSSAYNYTAGRWIKRVELRDEVSDQVQLQSQADTLLDDLSHPPLDAKIQLDICGSLARGHIVRTSGLTSGNLSYNGGLNQRYRAAAVTHHWWRGGKAYTTLDGEWIGAA